MLPAQQTERVSLACLQCRTRRVKCDGGQPSCGRCDRDRKECTYQASRRGGLDKAALAKRRQRLRQEAEAFQKDRPVPEEYEFALAERTLQIPQQTQVSLQINDTRLLELYFEHFWSPFPFVLPCNALSYWINKTVKHGTTALTAVMRWIGSVYAPWVPSDPYYNIANESLVSLHNTPFNVQALMLFAMAQHNSDQRPQGRKTLDRAVEMALALRMNERDFAQAYSQDDPVLAESWRRTYYFLVYFDQEFAVVAKSLAFVLGTVSNTVDLPCEDEQYESGKIPVPAPLSQFNRREFEDVEVVYSSIAYLYDLTNVLSSIMKMVIESGYFSEGLTDHIDAKVASWLAMLPARKKDPLRIDGSVDEVLWQAHLSAAILFTAHRPYSGLVYSREEFTTESFMVLSPMPTTHVPRRAGHTARALKGLEIYTKLLAIPTTAEEHGIFTLAIVAQMATAQISACKNLLEDHALAIGRDRLRLSIGYLTTMGNYWPLAKKMAREVKAIARISLSDVADTIQLNAAAEQELPRDELTWTTGPSPQIDIYAGTTLPIDWNMVTSGYSSSSSSIHGTSDRSVYDVTTTWAPT